MRTDLEIRDRIKLYESKLHELFVIDSLAGKDMNPKEWKCINEKVMLLQWVLGVDIYREDGF